MIPARGLRHYRAAPTPWVSGSRCSLRYKWRGGVAKVEYDRGGRSRMRRFGGSHRSRSQGRMRRVGHPEGSAAGCGDGGRDVRIEVKQFA